MSEPWQLAHTDDEAVNWHNDFKEQAVSNISAGSFLNKNFPKTSKFKPALLLFSSQFSELATWAAHLNQTYLRLVHISRMPEQDR